MVGKDKKLKLHKTVSFKDFGTTLIKQKNVLKVNDLLKRGKLD